MLNAFKERLFAHRKVEEPQKLESQAEREVRLLKRALLFASQPYQKAKADGIFMAGTSDFGFDVLRDEDIIRVTIHSEIMGYNWYYWLAASTRGNALGLHKLYYPITSRVAFTNPYLTASPDLRIHPVVFNDPKKEFDPADLFRLIPHQVDIKGTAPVRAIEIMGSGLPKTSPVHEKGRIAKPLLQRVPA